MSDSLNEGLVGAFMEELKQAIIWLSEFVNGHSEGDLQDGFQVDNVDGGWVTYKGRSWGFILLPDPLRLSMSYGTHGPFGLFESHGQVLRAEANSHEIVWVDEVDPSIRFTDPFELAYYGLQSLASEVRDELPDMAAVMSQPMPNTRTMPEWSHMTLGIP